jgi:hypothetical protein
MEEEETEEYSSSSESEESEEEEQEEEPPVTPTPPRPAPPPPVKKKKLPKVKQPVFEPPTKEYTEVHHPPVKKKKKKKNKDKEEQAQEEEMEVDEEEVPPTPPLPVQKKKRKKPEVMTVPTNNPNVVVQVKKRKPGPKTQNVIIYEEDLPQPKIKLIKKTHKKGRPKTKAEVTIDEGMDIQDDKIVIDRPAQKTKELSARQLKRMELDAKFLEMEQVAGRRLRQTKNGKIDKRCVKERSPAQIAAARRLAEYNKELRKQKALEKNKSAVKEVISELAVVQHLRDKDKKEQKQQEQQQAPATFNLFAN